MAMTRDASTMVALVTSRLEHDLRDLAPGVLLLARNHVHVADRKRVEEAGLDEVLASSQQRRQVGPNNLTGSAGYE